MALQAISPSGQNIPVITNCIKILCSSIRVDNHSLLENENLVLSFRYKIVI